MKSLMAPKCFLGWLALLVMAVAGGDLCAKAPTAKGAETRVSKHAEKGISCGQCHGKTGKKKPVATLQCLECHGPTKDLAERTAKVKPTNPHENRHLGTEADCDRCHHEHAASENLCLPCHQRFAFKVP